MEFERLTESFAARGAEITSLKQKVDDLSREKFIEIEGLKQKVHDLSCEKDHLNRDLVRLQEASAVRV